jgi:plastocyanin
MRSRARSKLPVWLVAVNGRPEETASMLRHIRSIRFIRSIASAGVLLAGTAACRPAPAGGARVYTPRTRQITVTTVPLLVKEQQTLFPFLKSAFAKGGVLDGKEVYAFSPSTITVVEGDTVQLTLINPEDDEHSFVLPDLAVAMHPGTITRATYVARAAGIYPIVCAVQSHLPMMSGQLVVLSAASAAPASAGSAVAPGRR